jgi:hypothetical protein
MKDLERKMRLIPVATAALAASLGFPSEALAQRQFDGNWSVEVITERGECDKAYRYPVIVQNGRVREGGPEAFQASGSVAASGAVQGAITYGNDRATIRGRLTGGRGSGTWVAAAGSRGCSGRWNADKRG